MRRRSPGRRRRDRVPVRGLRGEDSLRGRALPPPFAGLYRVAMKPTFFATPAAFRRWLERNHDKVDELLGDLVVIAFQPAAEGGGCGEKGRFHGDTIQSGEWRWQRPSSKRILSAEASNRNAVPTPPAW